MRIAPPPDSSQAGQDRTGGSLPRLAGQKENRMTDPRTPDGREGQLPDALDQVPEAHPGEGGSGTHGSEDAELIADAEQGEGDVEGGGPAEDGVGAEP
jgi:hypothetical protein